MKKYVLFGHGGSGNHGCEAIVRSTIKILGENNKFFLYSKKPREDVFFGLNEKTKIIYDKEYRTINRNSIKGFYYRGVSKFKKNLDFDGRENVSNNKGLLKKNSVAISIGGDNYCYSAIVNDLRAKLNAIDYKKIPSVLWGCSVGKDDLFDAVIKDVKKYSLITVRESLTMQNLYDSGIKDNVVACSDSAFTLDKEEINYNKEIFDSKNVIGLNISDLMSYYEPYKGATAKNFIFLIKYLLKTTDGYIALIPHVNNGESGDFTVCKNIEKEVKDERVFTVGTDFNCMQLKYLISKCKQFIGCRTHSTVAAYSTCVPTLVVGYSVKSKGIAKDIFGDYKGLVVDGQNFNSDKDLTEAYISFSEREKEIKDRLTAFMPEYIKRAYNGKEAVENLFR